MRLFFLAVSAIFLINPQTIQAQTGTAVDPGKLAQCLAEKNFTMYGRGGCSACALEKSYFGESFSTIPYVECDLTPENRAVCDGKGITAYPTWEDVNGKQYKGAIPLDKLFELAGCGKENPAPINIRQLKEKSTPLIMILSANAWKYWGIFLAGLISFLAPCLIPLFPSYFSIITGYTFADLYGLEDFAVKRRVFISALFFSLGFAIVFTLLGLTGSFIGQLLKDELPILLKISGGMMVILGLMQLGRIKIPSLEFDYAWKVQKRLTKLGYLSATIAGITSALCWIPCIGPILASVLLISSNSKTVFEGMSLLFVYSLGVSFPFLLGGLFFHRVFDFIRNHRSLLNRISQLAGLILIVFGAVLIAGKYSLFLDQYYEIIGKIPFLENLRLNIPLIQK